MIETLPATEAILKTLKPVTKVCLVTKELYGHAHIIVDVDATVQKFIKAYRDEYSKHGRPHANLSEIASAKAWALAYEV